MSLSAFHGRVETRTAALATLATHLEAGRLGAGSFSWNEDSGSVAGCLTEGTDPQQWVDRFGLPRWLAYALDAVTSGADASLALASATAVFDAVRPGSDIGPLGCRVMCSVLTVASQSIEAGDLPPTLTQVLAVVQRLHGRSRRDDPPSAAEWRTARRLAMAETDNLATPQLRALGECIEAAGWDPLTSPTAVADVLRQWIGLEALKADAEFGWTETDHDSIQTLLDRMHTDHVVGRPTETRDVFELLETYHLEDARRLQAHLKFRSTHRIACTRRSSAMLVRGLETAA